MIPNIINISEYSDNSDKIIIIKDESDLNAFHFSEAEIAYIKKCFQHKKNIIYLNQFPCNTIIYKIIKEKPEYTFLEKIRKGAATVQRKLLLEEVEVVEIIDTINTSPAVYAFIEGLVLSNYSFLKYYKKQRPKTSSLQSIKICSKTLSNKDIFKLQKTCEGVYFTRDLVNEPSGHLNAVNLEGEIKKLAKSSGFTYKVFDKKAIEKIGMGGVLAVNQGSQTPPVLYTMEWNPKNAVNSQPLVFIGKGITFDTGGINLKKYMDSLKNMKVDMAGAASVIGIMYTIAALKVPVKVISIIPATDNAIGSNAMNPGDVASIMDGTTVEITNTDAEGRLTLADALCYAKQFSPSLVIDLATLTGSAKILLDNQGMAGMGNVDHATMQTLIDSSYQVYERIVQVPLWDEFNESLKSNIADLNNTGGAGAGLIKGGKFLEHFVSYPWIHLDFANAFTEKKMAYIPKGGTGIGIRLMLQFIYNYYKLN